MKSAIILGAGQGGRLTGDLLNPNYVKIMAFGDNNSANWDYKADIPIVPVAEALKYQPDLAVISVVGEERSTELIKQLNELGYSGELMLMDGLYKSIDIRGATLKRLASRIRENNINGAIAELGVYRGDFAWQLNALFPDRKLYLFDTFEGFDQRDLKYEQNINQANTKALNFSNVRYEDVLALMPHSKQVIIKKGYFPETAKDLETVFALVSIDADLYAPTLAGLKYFYPRLSVGGAIILHDYNSRQFTGVKKALLEYEEAYAVLPMVPLSDFHGSAVIIKA